MPTIDKMRINNNLYNLAGGGGGGISYIPGYGINIDPDTGEISWNSEAAPSDADIEALRQYLETTKTQITGILDDLPNKFTTFSYVQTKINDGMAAVEAGAWSSENIWSKIEIMPDEITNTVRGYVDSPGYIDTVAESVWAQTQDEFSAQFNRLNQISGEMEQYGQAISITPDDGVKITAAEDSDNYTRITNEGMEIISDGEVVARASGKKFSCIGGFMIDDWAIENGSSSATLLFYRVV